jgi:two-component system, chemotaxis family, protein-glutamate methylesterase/glutaminase
MKINDFFVAGIGASAGGVQALSEFFQNIPEKCGIAFCVITHLHRDHESVLDRIISKQTWMTVRRMKGVDIIQPDVIYVLPENVTASVRNGAIHLKPRPDDEIMNKAIDVFFHSLGEEFKDHAIGIVMSGMGSDGSSGIESIHQFGGTVMVQEPRSTAFSSMPDNVIRRDHPDRILPPAMLARNLISLVNYRRSKAVTS